jgi:hypothetical protein
MAMDFLSSLPTSGVPDFTPSPEETWALLSSPPPFPSSSLPSSSPSYAVLNNLVVSFDKDTIDQSEELVALLRERGREGGRGGGRVEHVRLVGTHLTPNTPQGVLDADSEEKMEEVKEKDRVWDTYERKWVEEVGEERLGAEGGSDASARTVAKVARRELDA